MKDCGKNGKCKHSLGKVICKFGKTAVNDEHCSLSGINVLLHLPLLRVFAKGDCLYNCCSVTTTGNESLSEIPRLLISTELHQNAEYYSEHPYFRQVWESEREGCGCSKHFPFVVSLTANVASAFCTSKNNGVECVKKEAFLNCRYGRWSPLICVMALCEVLGVTIQSCYPKVGNDFIEAMCIAELIPRKHQGDEFSICILWSRSGNLDNRPGAAYEPNHFAPVLKYVETKKTKTTRGLSSLDSSFDADSQSDVKVESVGTTTKTETKTKTERLPRAEKVDMSGNTPSPTPQRKTDKLSDISDKKKASTKTTERVKEIGLFYDKINQMSDAEKIRLAAKCLEASTRF